MKKVIIQMVVISALLSLASGLILACLNINGFWETLLATICVLSMVTCFFSFLVLSLIVANQTGTNKDVESPHRIEQDRLASEQLVEEHEIKTPSIDKNIRERYVDSARDELKYRNYPGDYPPDWEWRKREVKRRDKYTCQASENVGLPTCGRNYKEEELHVHHIIPISKGGDHSFENLITLCSDCHDKLHTHMRLNLDVSTSSTTSRRQISPQVRTLQDAIANEKDVWLDYYTKYRDDRNERIVTPINVYYRNGAAYLRALCHLRREERTFRISRIKNMRVLDSDD